GQRLQQPGAAAERDRPKIKISAPLAGVAEDVRPAATPAPFAALQTKKTGKKSTDDTVAEDLALQNQAEQRMYALPPLALLTDPPGNAALTESYFQQMSQTLENALGQFGVAAKVVEVCPGPVVTRYELQPSPGVKVNRIISLADDIALAMKAEHVRIEAPIPGKGAVGIEIPNQEKQIVVLKEFVARREFQEAASVLAFAVGKDIGGQHVFAALDTMPHLLIAGATGSGKSACINSVISSLLYRVTPRQVKFLMIDPKRVELTMYNGIPHLKSPVINDSREAAVALKLMVKEMEERYKKFAEMGVRDIQGYNQRLAEMRNASVTEEAEDAASEIPPHMPYVVIFIDELADLMMISANEVETTITRLAQMARGVGMHMVLATQRPSVDVITGVIKANFPSRIAFQVSSKVDSRTILDANGADTLLGRGDMLYAPASATKPLRVQGVFITTEEVERVVHFWKKQGAPVFDPAFSGEKLKKAGQTPEGEEGEDELFQQAVGWVIRAKQASTSMLQRRLKVGYSRAARLLDLMEEKGIVGPPEGSKPRKVLVRPEEAGALAGENQEESS
ncbi:DNA translocase FtsK, partial [candidate division FCPU426 bacterium]|nr:DNA translocase FtsK [candidate division FCPU426 bacterium]